MNDHRHTTIDTSLGDLTLVAEGDNLTGLYFPGHWTQPSEASFGEATNADEDELFTVVADQIRAYLAGQRHTFDVPVRTCGDDLSEQVWRLLTTIPYGSTTTYGDIAEEMGDRRLAQRIGQIVGHNPISIIIPCHRVVGANGALTGYAGGLERKQTLLALEEPAEVSGSRLF